MGVPLKQQISLGLYILGKKLRKRRAVAAVTFVAVLALVFGAIQIFGPPYDMERARRHILATKCDLFEYGNDGRTILHAGEHLRRYRNHPEAFIVNAHALHLSKEPRYAMSILERVLVDDPTRWDCRMLLAEIYATRGVNRPSLSGADDIVPPRTAARLYRGALATMDLHKSLTWAQEALRLEPTNPLTREACGAAACFPEPSSCCSAHWPVFKTSRPVRRTRRSCGPARPHRLQTRPYQIHPCGICPASPPSHRR